MKKTMKVLAMVLFVLSVATLSSCSKNETKILGKWTLDKVTTAYGESEITLSAEDFLDGDELTWEFKDDGYLYWDGDRVAYTIDGDILTISEDGYTEQMTIVELKSNSLVLQSEEEGVMTTMYFKR